MIVRVIIVLHWGISWDRQQYLYYYSCTHLYRGYSFRFLKISKITTLFSQQMKELLKKILWAKYELIPCNILRVTTIAKMRDFVVKLSRGQTIWSDLWSDSAKGH